MALIALLISIFQNCSQAKFTDAKSDSQLNTSSGIPSSPLKLGPFSILGVSGSGGTIGFSLLGERNPTVYWTASDNADHYQITISDMNGNVVCPAQDAKDIKLFLSSCALPDGYYNVQGSALGLGTTVDAPSVNFYVEGTGPSVVINPAKVSGQNASVDFHVTQNVSALASVVCTLSGAAGFTPIVDNGCLGQTNKMYSMLPYGNYTFSVLATDQAGYTGSGSTMVAITAPPCTPLVNYNPDCDKRIKATLYFHISTTGQPVWNSVNTYISQGINSGTLYFTDIWIPTRSFTSGFPSVSNRTEYFALDMRTKLQTSTSMPAGKYQLGILSDDGSIVSTVDASGADTELINQDGYTSTKFGCSSNPITLVDGQKISFHVRYFQGPRDAIALVLMYRPWNESAVNSPVACGTTNQNFFGTFPVPVKDPSDRNYPGTMYASLLTQGWLPVPAENFFNPDISP